MVSIYVMIECLSVGLSICMSRRSKGSKQQQRVAGLPQPRYGSRYWLITAAHAWAAASISAVIQGTRIDGDLFRAAATRQTNKPNHETTAWLTGRWLIMTDTCTEDVSTLVTSRCKVVVVAIGTVQAIVLCRKRPINKWCLTIATLETFLMPV